MFQNFQSTSEKHAGPTRLAELREQVKAEKLDAYLVPHADEYRNEIPPPGAWRLAWLTGFTGSAGYAIVTADEAAVFVDGRYTLQVREQVDTGHFSPVDLIEEPPDRWLKNWMGDRDGDTRIGFDPWLMTLAGFRRFEKAAGDGLVAVDNLIDRIWADQPPAPLEPVTIHPLEVAGKLARDKLADLREQMADKGADLALITDPASVAWAFNIRGRDTAHTPLALGYAVLRAEPPAVVFMDQRKMSREVRAYLTQLADLHPPGELDKRLSELCKDKKVLADPALVSVALGRIVTDAGGEVIETDDPVALPRAIKNDAEISGSRAAHLRDGIAITRFLYWLDTREPDSIDEIAAATKLEELRTHTAKAMNSELLDISFDTISAAGANAASPHYRVTDETNAKLPAGSLYLVDSGGQYLDGTTDITRTVAIGEPPDGAIEDFTLVLRGHIRIALARFPVGTRGVDIDVLAREALWRRGRDYAHGTGHGIGSYLSVHEGPQSISRRGMVKLEPGMIISNEPGCYREGAYGIRIENLVLVREPKEIEGGTIPVLSFETLSLAPIDNRLIDPLLLTDTELAWLNAYHGWVRRQLSPHLDADENAWLTRATRPLMRELPAASA